MIKRALFSILGGVLFSLTLAFGVSADAACGGLCPDKDPNCPGGGRFDSCSYSQEPYEGAPIHNLKCRYTCSREVPDTEDPPETD